LFLSAYPATITNRRGVLVTQRPTMAEWFQRSGYATAGFSSNIYISDSFGYGRGFDLLDDGFSIKSGWIPNRIYPYVAKAQRWITQKHYVAAPAMNRKVESWLRDNPSDDRPFFLWVHYMDVHGPYHTHQGWSYFDSLRAQRLLRKAVATPEQITPQEHEELAAAYRKEIVYTDQHIGLLLDLFRQMGLYEETVIILCADHGDEFREHGRYSHWRQAYDELIRVPLMIRHPNGKRGFGIDIPVGLMDILPTVVDIFDLKGDASELVGQSLWPAVRDGDTSHLSEFVVCDATPDRDDTVIGIRTERWKLIVDSTKGGTELYDLQQDPREETNVVTKHPKIARELEAKLRAELSRQPSEASGQLAGPEWDAAEEKEVLARLQALGYVDWVQEHQEQKRGE
jgi:arylsulfatase